MKPDDRRNFVVEFSFLHKKAANIAYRTESSGKSRQPTFWAFCVKIKEVMVMSEDSKIIPPKEDIQKDSVESASTTTLSGGFKSKTKKTARKGVEEGTKRSKQLNVKKTMIYRQIGAKIAYYRTLRQMSQRELANKVNLSTSTIGRIERGKYNSGVPISTLLDIAEGLRIELSSLVTFSEEEKKVWWEIDKNML